MVALFLLCGMPAVASADEPDDEALREAAEFFEQGAEYFFEGRYGRAIVEFRRAHRISPHPMILYNKSIAYHRIGNPREARSRAVQAREMGGLPEGEDLRNLARIDALTAILTAQQVADDVAALSPAPDDEYVPPSDDRPPTVADRDLVDDPPDPSDRGTQSWIGGGLMAVGGGALGFAVVTHFRLSDLIEDYEAAVDSGLNEDQWGPTRQEIEDKQRNGQIALYAGTAAAAVGLTLFFLDRPSQSGTDETFRLSVVPEISGHPGGMLRMTTRF